MNIQEQYFKGVPDYYPSMYLDGYTPQQIMYAVRNKMIREGDLQSLRQHNLQASVC